MPFTPDFQDFQRVFAAYLRDPQAQPLPAGVDASAAEVYGELVFTKLCSFIDACFPVCRTLLGEIRWRGLCRDFQRQVSLPTPWFREIPRYFVDFLGGEGAADLPEYLPELAHYEWVELAVDTLDCPCPAHEPQGDLWSAVPVLNPALFNLAYRWPVHRIAAALPVPEAAATHLAVFRDGQDRVRFCELNPMSGRLLEVLAAQALTGEAAVLSLAAKCPAVSEAALRVHGAATLADLHACGVILGSQR